MHNIKEISSYFLSLSDPESGEGITNLKLQKLCYYAQGFHLAMFDKPLFLESLEAWLHGPVVPDLYHEYKNNANQPIEALLINKELYSQETKDFLEEVFNVYGQFSAWKLRNMTHDESPWIQSYNAADKVISHESLKNFFKTLLVNEN